MKSILYFLAAAGLAFSADITAEKTGTVIHFASEGKTICDYQMEPGEVPEGVDAVFAHGAHLHPIYSPSGKLVTGNHPEDHRWHRGIWMAWTKTEFGSSHPDFWNQGKGEGKDKSSEKIEAVMNQSNVRTPTRPSEPVPPMCAMPTTSVENTNGAMIILIRRRKTSVISLKLAAISGQAADGCCECST